MPNLRCYQGGNLGGRKGLLEVLSLEVLAECRESCRSAELEAENSKNCTIVGLIKQRNTELLKHRTMQSKQQVNGSNGSWFWTGHMHHWSLHLTHCLVGQYEQLVKTVMLGLVKGNWRHGWPARWWSYDTADSCCHTLPEASWLATNRDEWSSKKERRRSLHNTLLCFHTHASRSSNTNLLIIPHTHNIRRS